MARKYLLLRLSRLNFVSFLPLLPPPQGSLLALQGCQTAGLFLQAYLTVFIFFLQFLIVRCFFQGVVLKLFLVECLLISLLYHPLFILRMHQILICFLKIYRLQKDMSFLENLLLHRIIHLPSFHLRYPPSFLRHFLHLIHLHLILVSQTSLTHLLRSHRTIHERNLFNDMDKILANFSFFDLNDDPSQKALSYHYYYYQSQDIHFHLQ